MVENRLQEWNDEQTHQLPEDELGRARLAYAMNLPDWDALETSLAAHRERVAQHFAQTVFGPGANSAPGAAIGAEALRSRGGA